MKITVITCTHSPRPDYLRRVLDALKAQTLPLNEWEFLLMDNVSKERLADVWDLSWHPHGRHIREEQIGKTHALLNAFSVARGELLIIVDDDNVLCPDYLAKAIEISREFPFLGAWGARIEGEYEQELPPWIKPYLHHLAIREVERDYWSNYHSDLRSLPYGAGLCVRKSVAEAYARALASRPASKKLDRVGTSLISAGDVDLAMTAYDTGHGTGMFRRLQITHLIPKTRLTVDYVCRLIEGIEYSNHILRNQRDPAYVPPQDSGLKKCLRTFQTWRLPEPVKSIVKAENRGLAKALADISSHALPSI
jgi:hypothetical protein